MSAFEYLRLGLLGVAILIGMAAEQSDWDAGQQQARIQTGFQAPHPLWEQRPG